MIIFVLLSLCKLLGGEVSSDQIFTDACKGVVQRCIFLLLGVQTSFPVDQENLTFIQNLNKTRSSTSLSGSLSVTDDDGPVHSTTNTGTSSTVNPSSEVRVKNIWDNFI